MFGEFLQYMYTGSIHLNNSSMLPVLTLADKYNIHDLGNVCRQYMLSHCHASLENLKVCMLLFANNNKHVYIYWHACDSLCSVAADLSAWVQH